MDWVYYWIKDGGWQGVLVFATLVAGAGWSISILRAKVLLSEHERLKEAFGVLDSVVKMAVGDSSRQKSVSEVASEVAVAVHQIRGSLTSVTNNMKYLSREGNFSGELSEALMDAQHSLGDVISQIEQISAQVKRHKKKQVCFILSGVLGWLVEKESMVQVEVLAEYEIEGESRFLQEVLRRLVDNARNVGATQLKIKAQMTEAKRVLLTVEDNGPGLADGQYILDQAMELDRRPKGLFACNDRGVINFHRRRTPKYGLYLCKRLLESMGGAMSLGSSQFSGVVVHIELMGRPTTGVVEGQGVCS